MRSDAASDAGSGAPAESVTIPRTVAVRACPICGEGSSTVVCRLQDRVMGVPGTFTYRCCHSCETIYQDPRVVDEDLATCYPDAYYTHEPPALPPPGHPFPGLRETLRVAVVASVGGEPHRGPAGWVGRLLAKVPSVRDRAFFHEMIGELVPGPDGGRRALDVGCGSGGLLRALASAGWEAMGVEWDPRAAEVAHRISGRDVRVGDFREVSLPSESYDLIVLQHVLEHLAAPRDALARIAELLAPGGHAVLIYPNPGSWLASRLGPDWRSWDPPRHLVFPSRRGLVAAASGVGLSPTRLRTSARHVANVRAESRDVVAGHRTPSPPGWTDRVVGVLVGVFAAIGIPMGEEVIAVLTKPR